MPLKVSSGTAASTHSLPKSPLSVSYFGSSITIRDLATASANMSVENNNVHSEDMMSKATSPSICKSTSRKRSLLPSSTDQVVDCVRGGPTLGLGFGLDP
jgi:hypothetical protein